MFFPCKLQPGCKVDYPILADPNRELIKELNMVDPDEKDSKGNNVPSRAQHIIGPDKKVVTISPYITTKFQYKNLTQCESHAQVKLSFLYPASTGRNMDEVLRALDSLQKASKHKIATPANWKNGESVVISPSVSDEEAKKMFPQGFQTANLPSNKGYLRFTKV